ncbi:hypothetical protein ACM66B_003333 [Microbotryomycetes sp. NB124-2]
MVATSTVTALAVRTYAWLQMLWGIGSCLNSPSTFSLPQDCFKNAYFCDGVRSLDSLIIETPGQYHDIYYDSSTVTYYGITRSNLTRDAATLNELATGLLVAACQSNTTCNQAYASNSSSFAAIQKYVASNTQKLINKIPSTGTMQVAYGGHSFTDIWNVVPDYNSEVFGIHDILPDAIVGGQVNFTRFQEIQRLKELQSGGMAMLESLLNHIVFASYSCSGFLPTSSSASARVQQVQTQSINTDAYLQSDLSDAERYKIYQQFQSKNDFLLWAGKQKGALRTLVSRLSPAESMKYLQESPPSASFSHADQHLLSARSTCPAMDSNKGIAEALRGAAFAMSATSTTISFGMMFDPVKATAASSKVGRLLQGYIKSDEVAISQFLMGTLSTSRGIDPRLTEGGVGANSKVDSSQSEGENARGGAA